MALRHHLSIVLTCSVLVGGAQSTVRSTVPATTPAPAAAAPASDIDTLDLKVVLGTKRDFIFSTGANFDLLDGMKANSAYVDLRASVPGNTRIGLDFKINRFRTSSAIDSTFSPLYNVEPVLQADTLVGITYVTTQMRTQRSTRFENIGVAVTPRYRIYGDTSSLRAYRLDAIVGFEWFRSESRITIDRTFERSLSDSVPNDWPVPYQLTRRLPAERELIKSTADILYFSAGIKYSYRNAYGVLNAQVYGGHSKSRYVQTLPTGGQLLWVDDGFWGFQAEVIETRKSGVKIGVEVRGYMTRVQPTVERNLAWYNVYLAKEFSLEKIGELFTAN